ncbi:MAG TPA: hypothetical protein VFR78_04420 [Pyrinomonadaceae bacterium]|nr:hypothetical protein [Pyrinomonadaceae bacterium]
MTRSTPDLAGGKSQQFSIPKIDTIFDFRKPKPLLSKPGGAFPFPRLPASDLADTHVDLETIWGRSAAELRERLCEAISALAAVEPAPSWHSCWH